MLWKIILLFLDLIFVTSFLKLGGVLFSVLYLPSRCEYLQVWRVWNQVSSPKNWNNLIFKSSKQKSYSNLLSRNNLSKFQVWKTKTDLQRIVTLGSFSWQHDTVSSIKNGVCNIGSFSAGRPRLLHHRLQHLGCADHPLCSLVALGNYLWENKQFKSITWDSQTKIWNLIIFLVWGCTNFDCFFIY